jgi:predicted RNase H-like HicB family nuclease
MNDASEAIEEHIDALEREGRLAKESKHDHSHGHDHDHDDNDEPHLDPR